MHSLSARANAVFCYGLFVLFGLACLNAVTHTVLQKEPVGHIAFKSLEKLRPHQPLRSDHALITFDWDVDFTRAWTWNTKQVFVRVYAEYATAANPVNQVVIFDQIVRSRADAHITGTDVYAKYWLADLGFNLRNRDIRLHVAYDMVPITGLMQTVQGPSTDVITMPPEYVGN